MPQSPDGLEVVFDITFDRIPCALLAVDADDPTGQSQSFHIDKKHRVWKHRLDKDGNTIGRKSRFELGGTLISENQLDELDSVKQAKERKLMEQQQGQGEVDDEQYCGSCYGASPEGECCNTCDDVKRAYKTKQWHIPDITTIDQCKHLVRAEQEDDEGCNVH